MHIGFPIKDMHFDSVLLRFSFPIMAISILFDSILGWPFLLGGPSDTHGNNYLEFTINEPSMFGYC